MILFLALVYDYVSNPRMFDVQFVKIKKCISKIYTYNNISY